MNNYSLLTFLLLISSSLIQAQSSTQEFSYAYGQHTALVWKKANIPEKEQNIDQCIQGIKEGLAGNERRFKAAQEACAQRWASTTAKVSNFPFKYGIVSLTELATHVELPITLFDFEAVKEGYEYAMKRKKIKQTEEELAQIITSKFKPYQDKYDQKEAAIDRNIQRGVTFLAENAKKEGIVTLASGLQYQVLQEGTGIPAAMNYKIRTFYKASFIDGRELLSRVYRSDELLELSFKESSKEWIKEGYVLLKGGGHYRFFVPHQLLNGRKNVTKMYSEEVLIPGGSVMIYDFRVVEVLPLNSAPKEITDVPTISFFYGVQTAALMQRLQAQYPSVKIEVEQLIEGFQQNLVGVRPEVYNLAVKNTQKVMKGYLSDPARNYSADFGMVLLPYNKDTQQYPSTFLDYGQFRKGFEGQLKGDRILWTTHERSQALRQYFDTFK